MRLLVRAALVASMVGGLAAFVQPGHGGAVFAQAGGQAGGDEDKPPQQVELTQEKIDSLIAAQAAIRPIEEKMGDKPDPKSEAKIEAIAKKHGFATSGDFAAASYSVGIVLAGMDPETKTYVGPMAVLKKQIAQVKADTKMPPQEKKEALQELNGAMTSASSDKPLPANVEIVGKNFEKLNAGMQQDSN